MCSEKPSRRKSPTDVACEAIETSVEVGLKKVFLDDYIGQVFLFNVLHSVFLQL